MAWVQAVQLLRKAGPLVAKQLPKLWPLLLESRNRQRVMEAARDLASQSPTRRLRARVTLTAEMADGFGVKATTPEDKALSEDWVRRANNIVLRLDMPVAGRQAKAAHRQAVAAQLDALQSEMNRHLAD